MWVGLQGLTVVSGVLGMCFIMNKFRVNLLQHLNWHSTTMSLMNGGMKIIQCHKEANKIQSTFTNALSLSQTAGDKRDKRQPHPTGAASFNKSNPAPTRNVQCLPTLPKPRTFSTYLSVPESTGLQYLFSVPGSFCLLTKLHASFLRSFY